METFVGKLLSDLSAVASRQWYTAVGCCGLGIFVWAVLAGTPHDDGVVAGIGAALVGAGFGEGETRTMRERIGPGYKITQPVRRLNGPSVALYGVCALGGLFSAACAVL